MKVAFVPTVAPCRYSVCREPAAARTTSCQAPSLTALVLTIGETPLLFQNSAFSLPSVPT